jgi:hypothetical protein
MQIKVQKLLNGLAVLMLIASLAFAGLSGDRYVSDKNNFEISLPNGWGADLNAKRKELVMGRKDGITEVAVEVLPLTGKQNDAKAVARDHIIAYDGWQYVAGRDLGWLEKHGANSGFSAMYTKVVLGAGSTGNKIIVQEYYFVKNGRSYIVSLITDSQRWFEAKPELLSALASFKVY